MITALFPFLASGAGGGLLGTVTALFKHKIEAKERIDLQEVMLKRDQIEADSLESQRTHEMAMLNAGAEISLQTAQVESESEAEIANQAALKTATTTEFKGLKTSSFMDNYRASVRPTLAYWFTFIFNAILFWAFWKFSGEITQDQGVLILLGLFATLEFVVTSLISFYYVSRRNAKTII